MDYKGNKAFRLLNMFERLNRGEGLSKSALALQFNVSEKTVQRDIEDLRCYICENHYDQGEAALEYNKADNKYYLLHLERDWFSNEEALAICKILLESRAFSRDELKLLVSKLTAQIAPRHRDVFASCIRNEFADYIPLRHGKPLMALIWRLAEYIRDREVIELDYKRKDGKESHKILKGVSVMFSEFYFYLIAYDCEKNNDYPYVFRLDRIKHLKAKGEKFVIPYSKQFDDGEFRKRVQFMYSGELKTVRFEYSGVLDNLLDRLPTARVLEEREGVYTVSAETFGNGIFMWLRAEGRKVKLLK